MGLARWSLAWLCFALGAVLRVWSTIYIGGRKNDLLVCEGPYSLCRNPLYLGSFLLALSACLFLGSAALFLGLLAVAIFYVSETVPAEEQFLRETLGERYVRYCRQTPRFLPRWRSFYTSGTIPVRARALRIEFQRLAVWIWIPLGADAIHFIHRQPWWPQLTILP